MLWFGWLIECWGAMRWRVGTEVGYTRKDKYAQDTLTIDVIEAEIYFIIP